MESSVTTLSQGTMRIEITAYQILEKTVKESGNSGRVYVPKEWVGKKVKIALIESLSQEDD
jgi:putative transposon-encoded protein